MMNADSIPLCDTYDDFAFDTEEVRDLIRTTPLRFSEDGMPDGYDATQLFGLEAAHLGGRL